MFQPARWKAYLKNIKGVGENDAVRDDGGGENIYHIFHSEMLWFIRDKANVHNEAARQHLERCDSLLEECTAMVDALEETLANTPKPSEVLDWCSIW